MPFSFHQGLRLAAGAGLLALWLSLAAAEAGETLKPVIKCPTSGPRRACLLVAFNVPDDSDEIETREEVQLTPTVWAIRFVTLNGRLAGSPVKRHTLAVNDLSTMSGGFGRMPYLGRSQDNKPIILTDRGPLEIVSSGFDLRGADPQFIIVDEKRGVTVGEYDAIDEPFYEISAVGVRLWRQSGKRCISDRGRVPGPVMTRAGACVAGGNSLLVPAVDIPFKRLGAMAPAIKDFEASDEDMALGQYLGAGTWIRVYRAKGTPFLIIRIDWVDEADEADWIDVPQD